MPLTKNLSIGCIIFGLTFYCQLSISQDTMENSDGETNAVSSDDSYPEQNALVTDGEDRSLKAEIKNIKVRLDAIATNGDSYTGDSLWFNADAGPFESVNEEESKNTCAPKGTQMRVAKDYGTELLVIPKKINWWNPRILITRNEFLTSNKDNDTNEVECEFQGAEGTLNPDHQYKISKSDLNKLAYDRTGWVFGGLVVPFKYYLGGDKRVATSTTVAPYIGFKDTRSGSGGLHFIPVFSAGLGLVPVNTTSVEEMGMVMEKSETKSALSIATGFRVVSQKSEGFNAGILFGKDFLSNTDRKADPTVDEYWVSIFAGYTIK